MKKHKNNNMEHAAQVENVLVNEIDNQNGVHLYLEGNKWCAYERSAYYLAQLKVPVVIKKEIVRDGYDVVLLKAFFEVDDMRPSCGQADVRCVP